MACVAWCDAADILVDGSPGGAAFMKGAHKARGCRPGRADLLVLEAGADGSHGLAVELNIGGNGLQCSQVAWLARARLKGWRTEVVRARSTNSVRTKVVRACDPVDIKHLLILYGRKDAPCADHSTTALRSRCDRPMAYASGVCVWHMRGCACGSSRRRSRAAARRAAARRAAARRAAARRTAARRTAARGAPSLVAPPLVAPPLSRRALLSPLAPSPCLPRRPPPSSCCCTNPAHGLNNHWASAMGE